MCTFEGMIEIYEYPDNANIIISMNPIYRLYGRTCLPRLIGFIDTLEETGALPPAEDVLLDPAGEHIIICGVGDDYAVAIRSIIHNPYNRWDVRLSERGRPRKIAMKDLFKIEYLN